MSTAGYIPEGGVWTAEERRRIGPSRKVLTAGEAARAAKTVAALERALGDQIKVRNHLGDSCDVCANGRALLAALKGER